MYESVLEISSVTDHFVKIFKIGLLSLWDFKKHIESIGERIVCELILFIIILNLAFMFLIGIYDFDVT